MKYKFIAVREPHDTTNSLVVFETYSDIDVREIVAEFELFMRGCGFRPMEDHHLDWVPNDPDRYPPKEKIVRYFNPKLRIYDDEEIVGKSPDFKNEYLRAAV